MTMREGIRRKAAHRCSNLRAVVGDVFAVENRCSAGQIISIDDHVAPDGRVMEVLSEHLCQGWLEGYLLTGRHGLFATYEAFAMVSASMTIQHTKWLDMDAAVKHCTAGASVWHWASNDQGSEPDVVLAAAGDTPTLEVVAAAWRLRKHAPSLQGRVVNVADLMCFYPPLLHPPSFLTSSPPPGQLSSLSTAVNGRSTRSCIGGPARNASMCAVLWRRGRRPRPSTWSSVTR